MTAAVPPSTSVDVWIGLDVGKERHYAEVCDDAGKVLFRRGLQNDQGELEALLDEAASHGSPALVIDQPGSIGQLALAVAMQRQIPVAYIPGLVLRRAAQLYPGEAKTDPRDAHVLADTARTRRDQIHWLAPTDEQLEQLRVLNGFDTDLAADVNRTANRLRDALTSVCPALERTLGDRLGHAAVRALLIKFPTPSALQAAGPASIRRVIKAHAPRLVESLPPLILDALRAQTLRVPAEATLGRIVRELAAELDRLHARRDQLLQEIEALFLAHPLGPILFSLPGIGPRTGARILAEIADGSGFASGAKLASYAGLAPVVRRSGSSIKGEHRSRRGNHRLKNALFLAAFASLRSPASRAYYDRKRSEGKRHNAAVICLARRRCDVILAMLRSRQPYRQPVVLPSAA